MKDLKEDFLLQLLGDYVLQNEILSGSQTKQCLRKLGIKHGMKLEDQFGATQANISSLSVKQYAELVSGFLGELGGSYVAEHMNEEKVVFSCGRCPFGHLALKVPSVCEISAGIMGSVAARNFSYSKVVVEPAISQLACRCKIVVYLQKTTESLAATGSVFSNEPHSYLLTRTEVQTLSEEAVSTSDIYQGYKENIENLQSVHREMETEFNQLRDEIFSDLGLGVLTVGVAGSIVYMNRTAHDLLRGELGWDAPVMRDFQQLVQETINNKTRHNQCLLTLQFPDGNRIYSVNTAPLLQEDKQVTGAVSVFQDVTEQKKLESDLLQMEKFSLVAELAAGTAHEIRNPLTTMRGFLQILGKEFNANSKGYEYCELMIEEIDRANGIIKEFLLLTKPAAPNLQKCNIHHILDEIFMLIESKSLLENVKLVRNYAKKLPLVKADPAQIKQVFLNLATNAIQAMPAGGMLTIATAKTEQNVVVSFSDTGHGIAEGQLAKLFNPFFTTKEQGTGLGLTISYRIIENHQGKLSVESTVGEGTTFYVDLPAL